jgi:hypothetical protein
MGGRKCLVIFTYFNIKNYSAKSTMDKREINRRTANSSLQLLAAIAVCPGKSHTGSNL